MKRLLTLFTLILCFQYLYAQPNTTIVNPEDVKIARDKWGVPHIYGKTDADVIYGLAWAQAEDNFELMQLAYAATERRAGEILGKEGAIFDVMQFMCEADRIVAEQYDQAFSKEFKVIMGAYAQGVNDYASMHPDEVVLKNLFPIDKKNIVVGYILQESISVQHENFAK